LYFAPRLYSLLYVTIHRNKKNFTAQKEQDSYLWEVLSQYLRHDSSKPYWGSTPVGYTFVVTVSFSFCLCRIVSNPYSGRQIDCHQCFESSEFFLNRQLLFVNVSACNLILRFCCFIVLLLGLYFVSTALNTFSMYLIRFILSTSLFYLIRFMLTMLFSNICFVLIF
jgi:hypothetical protein